MWQTTYPTVAMVKSVNYDTLRTWDKNLPAPQTDVERTIRKRIDKRLFEATADEVREYTSDLAGSGQFGICAKCKKGPTDEGHDGCLGALSGPIMNACCGHGNDRQAYIQYWGGRRIAGDEAIAEQAKLIQGDSDAENN